MQATRRTPSGTGAVVGLGLGLVVLYAVVLMSSSSGGSSLIIGPALFVISLPVLSREAGRQGDKTLFRLLVLSLALKLIGALLRYFVAFDVYGGVADADGYHDYGVLLADNFRHGNFATGLDSLTGTDFIRFFTGIVYTLTGPGIIAGFLFYSWLSFWGLLLFYKAFVVAVPEGRTRTYARLVLFFPSMLFWPSSIGKEAWMIFSLGIAAYGAAHLLSGRTFRGLVGSGLGLWLAALVRPHVAGMIMLGLGAGYLIRKRPEQGGPFAPLAKPVALVALVVLAVLLVARTREFLHGADITSASGITQTLQNVSERSAHGGSEFDPTVVQNPGQVPVALGTVLFRPLITEAHNAQSLLASLEATFLFGFTLVRIRWILTALRSMRRRAYVALAFLYTGIFVVGFASFPNFGLLARQRVQLLPLYFVLLSIPPPQREDGQRPRGARGPTVRGARERTGSHRGA